MSTDTHINTFLLFNDHSMTPLTHHDPPPPRSRPLLDGMTGQSSTGREQCGPPDPRTTRLSGAGRPRPRGGEADSPSWVMSTGHAALGSSRTLTVCEGGGHAEMLPSMSRAALC